jgi:hypothetical protein
MVRRDDFLRAKHERRSNMSSEQRAEVICNSERAHYGEFHVEEDEEKFVVVITGGNAGGRLERDGIARRQNAVTRQAFPWTSTGPGFPTIVFMPTLLTNRGRNSAYTLKSSGVVIMIKEEIKSMNLAGTW